GRGWLFGGDRPRRREIRRRDLEQHFEALRLRGGFRPDAAVVQLDDAAADREPQAAAALVAAAIAEAHEALEDPLPLCRRDAGSLILHADSPHPARERRAQGDDTLARRGVERVGQQVEEHLTDALRLEGDETRPLAGQHETAPVMLRKHARILRDSMEE